MLRWPMRYSLPIYWRIVFRFQTKFIPTNADMALVVEVKTSGVYGRVQDEDIHVRGGRIPLVHYTSARTADPF